MKKIKKHIPKLSTDMEIAKLSDMKNTREAALFKNIQRFLDVAPGKKPLQAFTLRHYKVKHGNPWAPEAA